MNRHQVLTGAVNSGDNCFSTGSVEGVPFTAYAAGCNIVILASDFTRVQIIPGILHGNVQVSCLDASTDVGKIAVCFDRKICVFEPTPLLDQNSSHKLDYKWIQTASLESDCNVTVMSWNLEGTKLLSGGSIIQMWQLIGNESEPKTSHDNHEEDGGIDFEVPSSHESSSLRWDCVWRCKTALAVFFLEFSPDGTLFISAGKSDRLVKIWYESAAKNNYLHPAHSSHHPLHHHYPQDHMNNHEDESHHDNPLQNQQSTTHPLSEIAYSFVYIAHPRAVTGISWRKTSKYTPRGCSANMLVTSSKDNICRLWIQTLLPDDGMVNVSQIEELAPSTLPRVQTQRHRQKLLQRIRQMRSFNQFKKKHDRKPGHPETEQDHHTSSLLTEATNQPIPNLPSTFSVHDFHTFGIHGAAMTPGLHFHLAAAINAETDIPLVPSISSMESSEHSKPNFVMHWLNNKEMTFTRSAEKLLHDVSLKIFQLEQQQQQSANGSLSGHGSDAGSGVEEAGSDDHDDVHDSKKLRHKLCKPIKSPRKHGQHRFPHMKQSGGSHVDLDSKHGLHSNASSASLRSDHVGGHAADSAVPRPSSPMLHVNGGGSGSHTSSQASLGDFLDRKFESMLRKWQSSPDVLFSIHPIDGSLLVWLVDWLDETCPGSFRQAQVNFSTRIPNAIPLWDASTMSQKILLFSPYSFLDIRTLSSSPMSPSSTVTGGSFEEKQSNVTDGSSCNRLTNVTSMPTPIVYMISKHMNGSLNQWAVTFAESSNFTQVLSVSHKKRVCGHRFRVNDIACHPVLPLMLTTSHHNLPGSNLGVSKRSSADSSPSQCPSPDPVLADHGLLASNSGFCSELILWKVDSVGPLSKSGGVTELARINSPNVAAFANVAWIPTLLPSSTLGSIANSPSACFIASDGEQLRVYQAVIDARSLLAEMSAAERKHRQDMMHTSMSTEGEDDNSSIMDDGHHDKKRNLKEAFKVVSLQSTSRPGCILELSGISSAVHDWQNTQLLHVFQEQLIRGESSAYRTWARRQETSAGLTEPGLGAVVDLRHSSTFEEPFYLVVLEKNDSNQSIIHMWKLVISSQAHEDEEEADPETANLRNLNLIQDETDSIGSSRSNSPTKTNQEGEHSGPSVTPVKITTVKVSSQILPLPDDTEVIHATPTAGHLSSSNIYPACFAPYLLSTACSDGVVRFWKCQVNRVKDVKRARLDTTDTIDSTDIEVETPKVDITEEPNGLMQSKFKWCEWEMHLNGNPSSIEVSGLPLYVSCAFSGRMAVAFKHGQSFSKPHSGNPETRYMNINLAIYECESTGGSDWVLEDTIKLKNVVIPSSEQPTTGIDIEPLIVNTLKNKKTADTLMMRLTSDDPSESRSNNIQRLLSVPSYSTMQSLKKIISEQGNQFTLTQKSAVQLSWVSTEDGSHALTVSVGSNISVFTPVSTDIAQANLQAMKASSKTGTTSTSAATARKLLLKQVSMGVSTLNPPDDIRWMAIRSNNLSTADSLPPLPMMMSWVRNGILVVGMDNEMHIYTQWKDSCPGKHAVTSVDHHDIRLLSEHNLLSKAHQSSQLRMPVTPSSLGLPGSHGMTRSPSSLAVGGRSTGTETPKSKTGDEQTVDSSGQGTSKESDASTANIFSEMPDLGIFEASRLACPVLPQYHPKQLMELLSFGKIARVRAIMRHLVISLCSMDSMKSYLQQQQQNQLAAMSRSPKPGSSYRSRTLSISAPVGSPLIPSPVDGEASFPNIPEEVQLEYTEITSIRPLPLFTLVEAEVVDPVAEAKKPDAASGKSRNLSNMKTASIVSDVSDSYGGLFDTGSKSQVEETLDEILNKSTFNFNTKNAKPEDICQSDSFGPKQSRLLTKLLTHSHLPGLSSTDQMHLIALADSVASFNPDDASESDASNTETAANDESHFNVSYNSLDDCGLRFLLTIRQHMYLLRSLPLSQRKQLHKEGISTCNMVWAFHSESQPELVQMILKTNRDNVKWSTLRELGLGWWIRNPSLLKDLIEKLAKSAFKVNNDPLDAALFYLAMKKKSLVWGLFRSIGDKRMTEFFQNNFTEEKWRKAALKNAYALMGKQRFEHAAAFFLLAGSVSDAVQTVLTRLDDVQLAMVIVRLYEGDLETVPESLKSLLYKEVLGRNKDGSDYKSNMVHPDPFLRSMSYWILQDYSSSLTTLLEHDIGYDHPKASPEVTDIKDDIWVHPSVFNFYLYLRTQPLIVRRHFAKNLQENKRDLTSTETLTLSDAITTFERRLFFITAHQHFRAGCPSLALEVLSRLPGKIVMDDESILSGATGRKDSLVMQPEQIHPENVTTGTISKAEDFDWGAPSVPEKKEETMDFDWGAPVTNLGSLDTTFKIEIDPGSDKEVSDDEEEEGGLEMKSSKKEAPETRQDSLEANKPPSKDNQTSSKNLGDIKLDIMAQQLKFIACLKIIMEELSTLATGYEVDGGQLRYYLYVWLEKTVNALKTICSYRTLSMRGNNNYRSVDAPVRSSSVFADELSPSDRLTPRGSHSDSHSDHKPTLHEILLADKLDFEAKMERAKKRKEWLRSNEALLRTLLSYCSLHGAHGGGLASVRMELILLLQELQQEQNQHQLLSPLPFPTTLPLLAASVACQKTVTADPLRHLQFMSHDIIQTVIDLEGPPLVLPPNYSQVYVLRDLGTSLSACIYQSLCDSETIALNKSGPSSDSFLGSSIVCPNSHLLAGSQALKRSSTIGESDQNLIPTTAPNKWPGVQSLRALLAKDKDEDSPKLHTLLCESYVAVYCSQLLYAFSACDSHMLYRLLKQEFTDRDWSALFGGGAKKLIHVAVSTVNRQKSGDLDGGSNDNLSSGSGPQSPSIDLLKSLSNQRVKLHMKILQQVSGGGTTGSSPSVTGGQIPAPNIREDRPTYREQFVPPRMSILSCLMAKPKLPHELMVLDYDSSDSLASDDEGETDAFGGQDDFDDDDLDDFDDKKQKSKEQQISDHEKYAWGIIRVAVLKLALSHVNNFLNAAGIEVSDLPSISPAIHATLKTLNCWIDFMRKYMEDLEGPPAQFLPNVYVEATRVPGTPAITKYKALLELNNTPFKGKNNAITKPAKRLWNYLVRQQEVQEVFVRFVFGKPKSAQTEVEEADLGFNEPTTGKESNGDHHKHNQEHRPQDIVRIVHRDHDSISSFCLNQTNHGIIAIATPKEIQEMNISPLLEPVLPWLREEAEYDIKNLIK